MSILYGWLSDIRSKEGPNLQGSFRDFLELAQFCEIDLDDEYLATRITEEAHMYASDKALAPPGVSKDAGDAGAA